jgi:hypothetical protein
MAFKAVHPRERARTDWDLPLTHIRLIEGRQATTKAGTERQRKLKKHADANGVIPLATVFAIIEPERNLGDREKSIKSDLRCYSNPVTHGNNGQNKGWLELGYIVGHAKNSGSQ